MQSQPQLTPSPEAKLAQQKKKRQDQAETRKAKKHAKSEAKKARKSNLQLAAKSGDPEQNGQGKQEKRRKRMLARAEKLEAQAKKLMLEAKKARARFEVLTELKQVRFSVSFVRLSLWTRMPEHYHRVHLCVNGKWEPLSAGSVRWHRPEWLMNPGVTYCWDLVQSTGEVHA